MQEIVKAEINEKHYQALDMWKAIYAGNNEELNKVVYHTIGGGKKTRRRHSLNMAKVSASELAKLIFTENVQINISNKKHDDNIKDLLSKNRFYKVFQEKVEQMFALGGLILKTHVDELPDGTHKMRINYVTPDCFIPLSWENGEIREGVFLTISKKDNKTYCLFEFHRWVVKAISDEAGNKALNKIYSITNELYESDSAGTDARNIPLEILYPDLQKQAYVEGLTQPMFQYIKPNIANNMDLQSPLGISIFANATDTLKAIDIAFDSFIREFRLGRRRIIVPQQAVKTVVDPATGEMSRYFDADDEVYQAFNFADAEKQQIADNTVSLRVEEHLSAINGLLNLYAMQTGFSTGTFTFDGQSVKTATEIISENSKTFQTIRSNENTIEEGLGKFILTLTEVAALYDIMDLPSEEFDIDFYWDDSIIGDKYTDSDFYIKLKQNGLVSAKFAIMKILEITEEQAIEMLADISKEIASQTPDIDDVVINKKIGAVE